MENKSVITSFGALGTNCWSAYRFVRGTRCQKVLTCVYPEKATCMAVESEVDYIKKQHDLVERLLQERTAEKLRILGAE